MVGLVFGLFFLALAGRAIDLQVIQADSLLAKADREIMKQVELAPRRGIIFDRHQEELALSVESDSVFARPLNVTDAPASGRLLAQTLGLDEKDVIKRLKQEKPPFVWVARRISPEKAQAVRALELPGVGLLSEPRRFYPYTSLASHVIGFAGLDAKGLEGVEAEYDSVLRGQPQKVAFMRDALGRTIHLDPQAFASLPEGDHVILTLDKRLQYVAEKVLAATVARYHAVGGMAAVMLPQTGEVLALASVPNFNPNVFGLYDKQTYRNRLITDTYEPGSTFKIFVAGAALMSGKARPESRYFCEQGVWSIGGRTIHDTHPYGQLSLAEIIKFSSNIGAAKVGQTMGAAELHRVFQAFGFGRDSDVDLPGESRGILRPAASWKPVDLANICFGQGVAVTGMQMLQAVSAIANGGAMMKPFLVKAVVDQGGKLVRETTPKVVSQPLNPQAARALTAMMVEATQPGGTGTLARVDPYQVAGKTGTAQKLEKGGYSGTDYMASFVGFLPADSPKVAVLVVIDTPRGQHYGGVVAGPAWSHIARAALEVLGVGGGGDVRRLQAQASRPPAQAQPLAGDPAPALKAGVMPNLKGFTLRQVMSLARSKQMQVTLKGWGRVVTQSPAPGASLPKDHNLVVELAPAAEGGA
jgi:cell division protein FtsI (penicillin-binding protein 3)